MNKRSQNKFNNAITKELIAMGAQVTSKNEDKTEFTMDTIVGKLDVSLYHDQGGLYSVFSRFEDVDRAKDVFDCNKFTGKYNFHASYKCNPVDVAIENAIAHFECTQPMSVSNQ